jgi:pyruvate formate lyase activating enzyme
MSTTAPPLADPAADAAVRGVVFDLQRASLHDGPGVRTTVFLKGCPLHCIWCHNPESRRARPQLGFDAGRCLGCRACVDACAHGVHAFDAEDRHRVDWARCTADGACVPACPAGALRLYGRETTAGEVLAAVRRDAAYYAASGGGLTLSGGEPTAQPAFCLALLRLARAGGIHTCLETCGAAPRATLLAMAPSVDLFLFDCKATGPAHRELTGSAAGPVRANLRALVAAGARVLLRCPLVPGVNDTDEHLRAIAALSRDLPGLAGVELLPYHRAGESKPAQLGLAAPVPPRLPTPADEARWRRRLTAAGCRGLRD